MRGRVHRQRRDGLKKHGGASEQQRSRSSRMRRKAKMRDGHAWGVPSFDHVSVGGPEPADKRPSSSEQSAPPAPLRMDKYINRDYGGHTAKSAGWQRMDPSGTRPVGKRSQRCVNRPR